MGKETGTCGVKGKGQRLGGRGSRVWLSGGGGGWGEIPEGGGGGLTSSF